MTLCIYSCGGALSTLFITSPDWNWSPRSWATGKGTDLIRCRGAASTPFCHLKPRRLFIYSSKDSLMWCWRGDASIMLCLILWAQRQSWHQPVILVRSAEAVPVSVICPYSDIRHLLHSCVIMHLLNRISPWLPWTSCLGLSQILT